MGRERRQRDGQREKETGERGRKRQTDRETDRLKSIVAALSRFLKDRNSSSRAELLKQRRILNKVYYIYCSQTQSCVSNLWVMLPEFTTNGTAYGLSRLSTPPAQCTLLQGAIFPFDPQNAAQVVEIETLPPMGCLKWFLWKWISATQPNGSEYRHKKKTLCCQMKSG